MTTTLPTLPPVPDEAEDLACDNQYRPLQAAQPIMFAEALDWAAGLLGDEEILTHGMQTAIDRLLSLARQCRQLPPRTDADSLAEHGAARQLREGT